MLPPRVTHLTRLPPPCPLITVGFAIETGTTAGSGAQPTRTSRQTQKELVLVVASAKPSEADKARYVARAARLDAGAARQTQPTMLEEVPACIETAPASEPAALRNDPMLVVWTSVYGPRRNTFDRSEAEVKVDQQSRAATEASSASAPLLIKAPAGTPPSKKDCTAPAATNAADRRSFPSL